MVSQRGGQLVFQPCSGVFDLAQQRLVFGEKSVGIMSFVFSSIGVLDVQIVNGPEMTVADGLLLARSLAECFDLSVELRDLLLSLVALGGGLFAFDGVAQVFDLVHLGG